MMQIGGNAPRVFSPNASSLVGKIAMTDRGGSGRPFTLKVKNAQNAGAIG